MFVMPETYCQWKYSCILQQSRRTKAHLQHDSAERHTLIIAFPSNVRAQILRKQENKPSFIHSFMLRMLEPHPPPMPAHKAGASPHQFPQGSNQRTYTVTGQKLKWLWRRQPASLRTDC